MKLSKTALALALAAIATNAMAANGWKSSVEVGVILTSGNTSTQSTNLKAGVEHESDKLRNEAKFEALNVKGDTGRLSERYVASGKSSYKYNALSYSYITAGGEHDPFSGYAYQVSGTLGYGHRFINSEKTTLDFEGGPGYRQTRVRGAEDAVGEGVLRLSGVFTHKLSKSAEFSEALESNIGEELTISKSVTAITAQVAGDLSMKTSLTVRHNSDVPAGVKNTDTETAVTLLYTF